MMRRFDAAKGQSVLLFGFVGLCLAYAIVTLFYGLDFSDSFYYINTTRGDYLNQPMVFLAYWLARGWAGVFGYSVLSFRLLNFGCYLLSCLAVLALLRSRVERKMLRFFFGLSLVMFGSTSANVFAPDSAANLLTVVVICLALGYVWSNATLSLYAAGAASALLAASRLPSAGLVPVVCLVCALKPWAPGSRHPHPLKQGSLDIARYLGSFALGMLLLVVCFYGSPAAYVSGIVQSWRSVGDTHGIQALARAYAVDGRTVLMYACVLFTIGFVATDVRAGKPARWAWVLPITLLFMLVYVRLARPYNKPISLFISAGFLLLMARTFYSSPPAGERLAVLFVGLASFVPALGSNTGLLKTVSVWLPMLPLFYLYTRNEHSEVRKYSHAILALAVAFCLVNKPFSFYEDSPGLFARNVVIDTGKLKGIRTSNTRVRYLEEVSQDVKSLRAAGHPVLLYGYMAHVFYYLLDLKPMYQQSFSMKTHQAAEVEKVRLQIEKVSPAIVIVDRYPGVVDSTADQSVSAMEAMIQAQHYTLRQGRDYRIWLPPGAAPGALNACKPQ